MIKSILIAICFIWIGLVLGISFLEAPLKFTAPGIDVKLGLGIGRIVFAALNKVELILCGTMILLMVVERPNKLAVAIFGGVTVLLLLQTFWLLPVLDTRAELIIQNKVVMPSWDHVYFIVLEVLKVITLILIGIILLRKFNDVALVRQSS